MRRNVIRRKKTFFVFLISIVIFLSALITNIMTVSAEDTVQVTYVWGVYNTNSSSDSNVFVENSVVTVTKGEVIPETDIPLMDATKYHNGFYVSDWKTASGNSWDFENDIVTEDITLYAQWTEDERPLFSVPANISNWDNGGYLRERSTVQDWQELYNNGQYNMHVKGQEQTLSIDPVYGSYAASVFSECNSDDPTFFGSNIYSEYGMARFVLQGGNIVFGNKLDLTKPIELILTTKDNGLPFNDWIGIGLFNSYAEAVRGKGFHNNNGSSDLIFDTKLNAYLIAVTDAEKNKFIKSIAGLGAGVKKYDNAPVNYHAGDTVKLTINIYDDKDGTIQYQTYNRINEIWSDKVDACILKLRRSHFVNGSAYLSLASKTSIIVHAKVSQDFDVMLDQNSENATIQFESTSEQSFSAGFGSSVNFRVIPENGYMVTGVYANNQPLNADNNGYYNLRMGFEDTIIEVSTELADYNLTIKYEDEDGNEIAESVSYQKKFNEDYSFDAPEIEGFTVDDEYETLSGTVTEDDEIVFKYTRNSYVITIKYLYGDGTSAVNDQILNKKYEDDYSVETPALEGYDADKTTVSGTVTRDETITVTYTEKNYNIIIRYEDENGNEIADSVSYQKKYNENYLFNAAKIEGFTVKEGFNTFSGTVTGDAEIVFKYIKNVEKKGGCKGLMQVGAKLSISLCMCFVLQLLRKKKNISSKHVQG